MANARTGEPRLLQRFLAAAQRGGGWVTYSYRTEPSQPLRAKAAYVTRLAPTAAGGNSLDELYAAGLYAAVCYGGGDGEEKPPGRGAPAPQVADWTR
eukprot:3743813-Prymnesium_polylepis.2